MTEPAAPPLPSEVGQPQPQPTGTAPPPEQPPEQPPATAADLARLNAALEAERQQRREIEQQLAAARQQGMSEQEKAVDAAREEGRRQAAHDAGLRVAAAEFRAAAAGRLGDVDAALEVLDLSAFVDEDGQVNRRRLTALVEKLAAALPPGTGRVPAGPMGNGPADGDFLRAALGQQS
jgi:hypothetical protein